jgi:hypothetical protein
MPADLYDRILDAVVARLVALNLAGIMAQVVRLKYADFSKGFPCVVCSYAAEYETMLNGGPRADEIGIPVLVQVLDTTLTDQNEPVQERELAWRGTILGAFAYQRLAGVPEVQTCLPDPRPIAEPTDPQMSNQPRAGGVVQRSAILLRFVSRV